jgi:hypothetical protein
MSSLSDIMTSLTRPTCTCSVGWNCDKNRSRSDIQTYLSVLPWVMCVGDAKRNISLSTAAANRRSIRDVAMLLDLIRAWFAS